MLYKFCIYELKYVCPIRCCKQEIGIVSRQVSGYFLTLGALLLLGVLSDVEDMGDIVPEDTDPDRTLSLMDSLKSKKIQFLIYVLAATPLEASRDT